MSKAEALDVLNNLKNHIIYDSNIKEICYSAQFIKALKIARDTLKEVNQ